MDSRKGVARLQTTPCTEYASKPYGANMAVTTELERTAAGNGCPPSRAYPLYTTGLAIRVTQDCWSSSGDATRISACRNKSPRPTPIQQNRQSSRTRFADLHRRSDCVWGHATSMSDQYKRVVFYCGKTMTAARRADTGYVQGISSYLQPRKPETSDSTETFIRSRIHSITSTQHSLRP